MHSPSIIINTYSLNNIPSVIYFKIVFYDVFSSNLIEYPTSSPKATSISSDTLFATLIAATLLGYVHAIALPLPYFSSKNYGIYVVLPLPVSPCKTIA
jgi:hypothetical protein